ncbi:MAG TPA: type II secretion system protein GspJ [Verrucomicrobiae bacterium]
MKIERYSDEAWKRYSVAAMPRGMVAPLHRFTASSLHRFNASSLQRFNTSAVHRLTASPRHGFTLLEMILATGIAALVLISISAVFFTALHLRDDAANMVAEAGPVDAAVTFIKRDLQCAVTPTNGASKVLSGSFRVGNNLNSLGQSDPVAIELYTATGALSDSQPWGDVQRVTYELKTPSDASSMGRDLYRSVVRNLLSLGMPDVTDQLMLRGVESVKFSCYDGTQWSDVWDTSDPTSTYTNLPSAVRVDIQMAGRADTGPIEIVVPIDSQSRTNMVLASSSGGN